MPRAIRPAGLYGAATMRRALFDTGDEALDRLFAAGTALCLVALVLLAALAGLVWQGAPAAAHSWYPYECCSDRDCAPLPRDQVQPTDGGWLLPDGTLFPYADARVSPDGGFHWCRIGGTGRVLCFFAPDMGV